MLSLTCTDWMDLRFHPVPLSPCTRRLRNEKGFVGSPRRVSASHALQYLKALVDPIPYIKTAPAGKSFEQTSKSILSRILLLPVPSCTYIYSAE